MLFCGAISCDFRLIAPLFYFALYALTNLKRCNSQNTIRFMSTFDNWQSGSIDIILAIECGSINMATVPVALRSSWRKNKKRMVRKWAQTFSYLQSAAPGSSYPASCSNRAATELSVPPLIPSNMLLSGNSMVNQSCLLGYFTYRHKKRSTAVLQPLLTLNLILWKTHCKGTDFRETCKLFGQKILLYNIY